MPLAHFEQDGTAMLKKFNNPWKFGITSKCFAYAKLPYPHSGLLKFLDIVALQMSRRHQCLQPWMPK